GGIVAGLFGVVGTVSYSSSPGVVLATRIASRYALTACGMFLIVTGLIPKLAAMFASVPGSVVGAALCVAIGFQIGAGIDVITSHVKKLSARDYLVIGLPLIVGTIVSMVPREFFAGLPAALAVIVSNGLVLGIIMVLVLEHGLLRKK
ncbi:MAG TPA: xanthine permease, partial [Deltaproteobacteria bacterium]|nr:xanthine permease [Deltaproteobacteria bacterium]